MARPITFAFLCLIVAGVIEASREREGFIRLGSVKAQVKTLVFGTSSVAEVEKVYWMSVNAVSYKSYHTKINLGRNEIFKYFYTIIILPRLDTLTQHGTAK